jgi:hypothetical protein
MRMIQDPGACRRRDSARGRRRRHGSRRPGRHPSNDVVRNGSAYPGLSFPTSPAYEADGLPAIFGSGGWECTNPGRAGRHPELRVLEPGRELRLAVLTVQ